MSRVAHRSGHSPHVLVRSPSSRPPAPISPRSLRGRSRRRGSSRAAARIVAASAPLRRAPAADAPLETEALHGEAATVYDEAGGWSWAQLTRDAYVGYLPTAALGALSSRPIASRRCAPTPIPAPASSGRRAWRSRSARGSRSSGAKAISRSRRTGCIISRGISRRSASSRPDFVAVAERFLEAPYLWGGRTSEGIDCSGLVQTALTAAGVAAPRDSDMMAASSARPSPSTTTRRSRRGDLVFWKGHVGVMRDAANAAARQRLAHEGGQRAARRGRRRGSPRAAAARSRA